MFQGMNDSEEWVVVVSIGALAAMTQEDIFANAQLFEVLAVTLPLLLHPNTVISQVGAADGKTFLWICLSFSAIYITLVTSSPTQLACIIKLLTSVGCHL